PLTFMLFQNYPNPFNTSTNIRFSLPGVGTLHGTSLRVVDLLGREIATLVTGVKPAGEYTVTFDASNLASGVYVYQLKAGDFVSTKRMLLLK
ncbi:MAG: T9SS type A sorting domain-containing protein, partial [Bacteroidota bacterium]